jgi:hypothetical protein
MTMTEHEEPDCVTAEFALRNFAPVAPFVLRWVHPVWQTEEGIDPARLKKAGRPNEHDSTDLLKHLVDGMSGAEWRKACGWTDGTFRRHRDTLIDRRKVRTTAACYYHIGTETE